MDDDALIEDADKEGNDDLGSIEHQEPLEGILDSPELASRRSMLKEKMHELSSHTAHGKETHPESRLSRANDFDSSHYLIHCQSMYAEAISQD